jgi:hypothetical protein
MPDRLRRVVLSLLVAGFGASALAASTGPATGRVDADATGEFVVHEWGTFTSVAGPDGQSIGWYPLSDASDLPCFVRVLSPNQIKALVSGLPAVQASVRMETPVLYFYADREMTASVSVRFPQGLISEWYPQAQVAPAFLPADAGDATGTIDWPEVAIRPGTTPVLPREPGESHYYPARETDASPIRVSGQDEKFLFYRGLASFPVTVEAVVTASGAIEVRNTGRHPLSRVILFENRDGRLGYRTVSNVAGTITIARPDRGRSFDELAIELTGMLVGDGLYEKEARAMVQTWRDSWFEEGTRLIYFVPRDDVDRLLPLTITPAPTEIARTFVGRLEIITPEIQAEVEQALLAGDLFALNRCGRFLQPIVTSLASRPSLAGHWEEIERLLGVVAASRTPEEACPMPRGR